MNPTALVTGASRGIGKEIAMQLAKKHYDLYLICRQNFNTMKKYADALSAEYGIQCKCYQGNVGNFTFLKSVFSELSSLDVLINNAGISHVGLLSDMTEEAWAEILNVNLSSVFYTCHEAIPLMLKKKSGCIINISSVWGNQGASMEVAYSATKGGVNAFTKALAKELAPSNISVNALACGLIQTEMNAHLSPEEISALVEDIPADRMGTPSDVAKAVMNMIQFPSYLTGQIITLDGGWI